MRVRIAPAVVAVITGWRLPEYALVEVHTRLQVVSPGDLRHIQTIFGQWYGFQTALIDPTNRFCEYLFVFEVRFTQDEESLIVVQARCLRRFP